MTTSVYQDQLNALLGSTGGGNTTTLNSGGNQTTNSNSTSNTSGTQNTTGQQVQNTNSTTTTLSKTDQAALDLLIKQLLGGGTQQQAADEARRQQALGQVQNILQAYSKNNAFTDAQGAIAQQQRRALEQLLPSIVRSAEGAGTSQNSMRALLLQDAANKAAESSSALGLKAAVDYGGIQGNLANTLATLSQPNNSVVTALINALNIAKGANTTTKGTTTTDTNQTTNSSGTQNNVGTQTTYTSPTVQQVTRSPSQLDALTQSLQSNGLSSSPTVDGINASDLALLLNNGYGGDFGNITF